MSSQHVLIIGAGVCGLAIAHGLQKAGIPFTIFEAEEDSAFRPREWTMALHWSIPMLEALLPADLAARWKAEAAVDKSLDYTQYPNNTIAVFDGLTGDCMREIAADGPYLRVSRRKLRAVCQQGISIQYGHCLQDVSLNHDKTVTAKFTNGKDYTGTLLVGSDGPRSYVRQHLFGAEQAKPAPLGVVYLNVSFQYPHADQSEFVRRANPVTAFSVHPEMNCFTAIQDVPDPTKPETWRFQLVATWQGTQLSGVSNEEKQKEVKDKAMTLAEPFRSAILWMPEEVEVLYSDIGVWVPKLWDTHDGRVTLAGDAAHSMPPNRGQGLNNAINDAYNFVQSVKKVHAGEEGQVGAMNAYSEEVVERGSKEVLLSRDTALMMLDYDRYKETGMMQHNLRKS